MYGSGGNNSIGGSDSNDANKHIITEDGEDFVAVHKGGMVCI